MLTAPKKPCANQSIFTSSRVERNAKKTILKVLCRFVGANDGVHHEAAALLVTWEMSQRVKQAIEQPVERFELQQEVQKFCKVFGGALGPNSKGVEIWDSVSLYETRSHTMRKLMDEWT